MPKPIKQLDGAYVLNLEFCEPYITEDCAAMIRGWGYDEGWIICDDTFVIPGATTAAEAMPLAQDWYDNYDGKDYIMNLEAALKTGRKISLWDPLITGVEEN